MSGFTAFMRALHLFFPVVSLVLLPAAECPAADPVIGTLTHVRGTVTIKRPGISQPAAAEDGFELLVGDAVRTAAGSAAQITLADETFINLAQDSSVRVSQYAFDRELNRRTAVVTVLQGMVRCVIMKVRAESSFKVLSANTQVTVDSFDDFAVSVLPKATEVVCLRQSVTVKNVASFVVGSTVVGVNQRTVVKENLPPSTPEVITSAERKQYAIIVR